MNYLISKQATKDLEKIWMHAYETWSLEQAYRYYRLILDEIDNIVKDPKVGKDQSRVREGYFSSKVKSHIIFYRNNRKKKVIEVIRILHQQMDIESRLGDL